MRIEDIKDKIENNKVAVATCNKNCSPHNIVIMYAKVKDKKIIVTDNYMKQTKENIIENNKIALVFWEGERGWKIRGKAEYHSSGKWLDFVKSLDENKHEPCKGAIVIEVEEIKPI
ncbi:MAG: pyridoxamine 5'-phosphate oxidase family protein [Nanoarchaeota archaeon]